MKYLPPGIESSTRCWDEEERSEFLSALKVENRESGSRIELSSEGKVGFVLSAHVRKNGKRGEEERRS